MGASLLAVVAAELAHGRIALTDIGTGAMVGGLLGEIAVRIAPLFGRELNMDGWREGMFFGALIVFAAWVSNGLEG
jgi:hypothetical protein